MVDQLPPGGTARVRVPASSANLGPGFDSCGLALSWYDEVTVTTTGSGVRVELTGEGADELPHGEDHLVVRMVRRGLAELGAAAGGLELSAHNTIPHGRGLGSSAAAIVAGLGLAWGLARPGAELDRSWLLRIASEIEGHPDNVAAAVLGGYTIAWQPPVRAVSLPVADGLAALALVPGNGSATREARDALPAQVPHADAARNAGRAALLTHAIQTAPELLLAATEDWLHQRQRAGRMPKSYALVEQLRGAGHAAVISGAGSTVLVLGRRAELAAVAGESVPGFRGHLLGVGTGVALTGPAA